VTNASAITPDLGAPAPLSLELRIAGPDDLRYVYATWLEEYKYSCPSYARAPFGMFKDTVGKQVQALVWDDATRIIAAYTGPEQKIAGWLAYMPGRTVSTVHFAYTRYKLDDDKLRRRGVMATLLDAAQLGKRFAYTHHGACKRKRRGGTEARYSVVGPPCDEPIATWLRSRGVNAAYISIEEWLR
jgi:hypothetical protein